MLLKYFYDPKLAQASYMVGCAATGEALVIDPARNITSYLEEAAAHGLRITHVTETHIHADFVSGSRELAARTGALLYLSDMGDENWKYQFVDENTILLRDGDWWKVGNIRIDVLHTPGHTPEHLSFMVTDTAGADQPMGVFTGDFLFVGDVGRPDLLEEAAGITGTKEIGARQQFANIQRFKDMPDYLQIWPGHGAGSACGKALGAIPSTTLGYEKLFNPAFQVDDEAAFVDWLLDGQPEAPRYFAQMKRVNKEGPVLLADLSQPTYLPDAQLFNLLQDGALVIDARSMDEYAARHVPGTLNIPLSNGFSTNVGWFVDYEAPTYLLAKPEQVDTIIQDLRTVGVDHIPGFFTTDIIATLNGNAAFIHSLDASGLAALLEEKPFIVDVRGESEYRSEHITGAINIPLGYLPRALDRLPSEGHIVLYCASGFRSQIGASLLRKHGFTNVATLHSPVESWREAGLPVDAGVLVST